MRIAIVGATGWIGGAITAEAAARGHDVTAIVRAPAKLPNGFRGYHVVADVSDVDVLTNAFRGNDAIVHAYAPPRTDTDQQRIDAQVAATTALIAAATAACVRRFVAVGGAGTSEIAPGVKLIDSYLFPRQWTGGARSTATIRALLEQDGSLDWSFACPPHMIEDGERTGRYRTGDDNLLFEEATGRSHISVADYAIALVDEIETPRHVRRRFTVGT